MNVNDVTLPVLGLGVIGIGTLTVGVVQIIKRLTGISGRMAYLITVMVGIVNAGLVVALTVWGDSYGWIGDVVGGYSLAMFVILFASGFYADNIKVNGQSGRMAGR